MFWIAGLVGSLARADIVLRLPFIALFAASTWLMYRLAGTLFGARAGLYAAVLLNLAPVFAVSTGSWVLPDGPLFFGQLLAAAALAAVVFGESPAAIPLFVRAGIGCGIALLSKYHAVLFALGLVVWAVTSDRARRWLAYPGPYIAALIAGVMAIPVVIWNHEHAWASVRFQLGRQTGHTSSLTAIAQNLGGQAAYLLPWIWIALLWQLGRALRRGRADERNWFLVCVAAPPILLFTAIALRGSPGLPHWVAPGFLFLVPLAGKGLVDWEGRAGARVVTGALSAAAAGLILPIALIASQAATGWMNRLAPEAFRRGDPSLDLLDWRPIDSVLTSTHLLDGSRGVFATHWIEGAKLGYALGGDAPVRCLCDDARHFRYLPPLSAGSDALVVVRVSSGEQSPSPTPPLAATSRFASITPLGYLSVNRAGREAVRLSVFLGRRLAPEPFRPPTGNGADSVGGVRGAGSR